MADILLNDRTINSIVVHKNPLDAISMLNINNNPNLLGELGVNGSAEGVNITLDSTDQYFMCSEYEGAYVVDGGVPYGNNIFLYGTFDTDIDGWAGFAGVDLTWEDDNGGCLVSTHNGSGTFVMYHLNAYTTTSNFCVVSFRYKQSAIRILELFFGDSYKEYATQPTKTNEWEELSFVVDMTGNNGSMYAKQIGAVVGEVFKIDDIEFREATAEEISNYAPTIRDNADFQPKGAQLTCVERDGVGVPIAYDESKLHWHGDGYGDTQWNPTLSTPWTLTETIATVENVVIDTDNTNENATYLLGKGTYQKVGADPYTAYEQAEFQIEEK